MELTMCKRNDIDFARFDARKLTPEQWERLQRGLLLRAHAARAQALRDLPGGVVRWLRAVASGGRDVVRLLAERAVTTARRCWAAYLVRRERRAAIRELGALDDRSLKDLGLHRSEIESVVYNSPMPAMPREFSAPRRHQCETRSVPRAAPVSKPSAGRRSLDKSAA
jgi:uncharacterized protein YjiS (DUF1127 family)